jgi:hypothetical protein
VKKFGVQSVYILSASWGLIRASFLTPDYDITLSSVKPKDRNKYRRKSDQCWDFQMLLQDTRGLIGFCGGKDYLPLFSKLPAAIKITRNVLYRSEQVHANAWIRAEAVRHKDAHQLPLRVREGVRGRLDSGACRRMIFRRHSQNVNLAKALK